MRSLGSEGTFDVIIIGAGLSGITSLYRIQKLFPSWRVRVLEAADDVGGTWYYNRYPGARFDSESVSYGLSCDRDFLADWNWSEEFASQSEALAYTGAFCNKNDTRRYVSFNTKVTSADWRADEERWLLRDDGDRTYACRFILTCVGILSAPQLPNIPGIKNFRGSAYHTSQWPHDFDMARDFGGKRIGVIGTGSTGIQTITEMSREPSVRSLTVFQRTANWCAPLRNGAISEERMTEYKGRYDEILAACGRSPAGFMHEPDPRCTFDVDESERLALWEELYAAPGFKKCYGTFKDAYTDADANRLYSDWMAGKMRSRVNDPVVAEKLVPKNHGFGTKRVPLDSGYLEAYNKPNVHLVDLKDSPIEGVTADGVSMADGGFHELDVLVFATGFDAITGALSAIDWHGMDGRPLFEKPDGKKDDDKRGTAEDDLPAIWAGNETSTFLGIMAPSLPNVLMVLGPHQPYGNVPRSIEKSVDVIMDLLQFIDRGGHTRVEPRAQAVDEWHEHVVEAGQGQLSSLVASWSTGVNKNVKGKSVPGIGKYPSGNQGWVDKCRENAEAGWPGLMFG
ncbi:hypothetical protein N3K66_000551 [Trichothecium roseum]|uniref:Uncharacterized protein n=1 Tax=Trichothecium roseum TaxID=47278 RepID=A0ACC0VCA9_9HYPO|nr:hypothetical protein N3K66_000551 [Trichothecium roseum]